MPTVMKHWNGHQLCAIDTETTGLEAGYHEIVEIAILPLDGAMMPRQDILPFNILIKPEFPDRESVGAAKVRKTKLADVMQRGFDKETARDLFLDWKDKLKLAHTKFGTPKKIMPLGQNYAFDKGFIASWLGTNEYDDHFFYHHRDTMTIAGYLNDKAAAHGEAVRFNKISLTWLVKVLGVEVHGQAHSALEDARRTAEVYRKLTSEGMFGRSDL